MVKRCVALFCGNTHKTGHSLHEFPKDPKIRNIWVRFVALKRKDFKATPYSHLCSHHFTPADFHQDTTIARSLGIKGKRVLIEGAVPSIQTIPTGTVYIVYLLFGYIS